MYSDISQAALWDNEDLLVDLLQEQADLIESVDSWGRAPIHAAAITQNSKCLPLLINAGANVNAQCGPRADNKTALQVASEYGHDQNVNVLLAAGASHIVRDSNGFTAFDLAEKSGHSSVMEMLKRAAGGWYFHLSIYVINPFLPRIAYRHSQGQQDTRI